MHESVAGEIGELGGVVPNQFPQNEPTTYRLALVGEAPGKDEVAAGKPFIGLSGKFLDDMLSRVNITRACCFVGNVMQVRPPTKKDQQLNPLDSWAKSDAGDLEALREPALQAGLAALRSDLERFKPHLVACLGKTALWAASGHKNLGDWRGSVFMSDQLIDPKGEFLPPEVKCLASYHPAACLRMYSFVPLLMFDLKRAAKEAHFPELRVPQRDLITNLSYEETLASLDQISQSKAQISCDIEGGVNSLSCISIASSATSSFIVPFTKLEGDSFWSLEQEVEIWRRLANIMADSEIRKVWQNGLYDRFVLQYAYQVVVKGSTEDTMLQWWELYCELEKALSVQTSIMTDEPFYKFERKSTDQKTFYEYCCRDSCVTYEINSKLTPNLTPPQAQHYAFNIATLNPLLYMELRGIKYNHELAKERLCSMQDQVYTFQERLDTQARDLGALKGIDWDAPVLPQVQEICCYKKDKEKPKTAFAEAYYEIRELLAGELPLTLAQKGRISVVCKLTMNTKSTKFKDFLYGTCKLPTQWKEDPKTKEMKRTTDYGTLLKLTKTHDHPVLRNALELSRLRTRAQMLAILPVNGRMLCSYNLVGSETGRITSSKSNVYVSETKRVGTNMQTIPDDWQLEDDEHPLSQGMRDLFLADEGCYIIKCDLRGSDGWTIGACMAALGDPTMLDDLKAKIKPAQVAAFILVFGVDAYQRVAKDRLALREATKAITSDMWQYFVSKQVIWGTAYTMGARKAAERIFIESDGKVNLTEKQTKDFQSAIYVRYRLKIWHNHMQRFLDSQAYPARLTASNGFTRRFFGRKSEILGEALAHLPQVVTTWATLKAAYRLWNDPENRIPSVYGCRLRIEPLHQVHDELVMQCKKEDKDWAIGKIREYFDNSITVSEQVIKIPFGGFIGTNWAMDEHSKIQEFE